MSRVQPQMLIHVTMELVECHTDHIIAIDAHLVGPPVEAEPIIRVREAGVSPDDQHRGEPDMPVAEIPLEPLTLFEIVEHRVPVDDLREAVLESGTPHP